MTTESSENGTSTTPFFLRPDNSLPIHTRDTYLLIATFVSVLIIMGIVIAFINRKCRNSLSRARFRLLHLRHRDALTAGHRRRRPRSEETPIHHIHSLHDPKSPVYSKEVNVSLAEKSTTSGEYERTTKKSSSWGSFYESGSCSSRVELDSGISVISSKTGISSCSKQDWRSPREKIQTKPEPTEFSPVCECQLVKVLMPETLVKGHDPCLTPNNDHKHYMYQVKRMERVASNGPFYDTKEENKFHLNKAYPGLKRGQVNVHEGASQETVQRGKVYETKTWDVGKRQLYRNGHQSSFDVISIGSDESSFDENCNRFQSNEDHRLSYDAYPLGCNENRETDLNANVKTLKSTDRVKQHVKETTGGTVSPQPPAFKVLTSGDIEDSLNQKGCSNHSVLHLNRGIGELSYDDSDVGLNSLLPTLQEFGNFLQERRRKLSFSKTDHL